MSDHGSHVTRRDFLRRSAALGTPLVIPSSVLASAGTTAPSNRIGLGFIGVGMMGQGHLHHLLHYAEVQVLGVCDVDRWRREHGKAAADHAYASRRAGGTYRACHAYNDLREMLARDDIDAIVVATGDNWQALATILAAKAGKDVYCEKPVALTVREARAMVDAVRRYGRVCQCGLQQRSSAEFRKACALVQGGAIGKVQIVYTVFTGAASDVNLPAEPVPEGLDWDLWLGPAPWRPFNSRFHHYGRPPFVIPWYFCRDFSGGNLASNAVHGLDTIQWGLGMDHSGPIEIIPPGTGSYPSLTYKYADGTLVQVVDGRLEPGKHFIPKGWDQATPIQSFGAVFVGERGWIHVGREGYLQAYPAEILDEPSGRLDHIRAVNSHHRNWLHSIRSRARPACDIALGAGSTIVALLGCIAFWTGRPLRSDPAQEVFLGDEEANRYLSRAMRPPWTI